MHLLTLATIAGSAAVTLAAPSISRRSNVEARGDSDLLTDISTISRYWGQLSPYKDNSPGYFGVEYTGLPDGCGVEQVQILQRHAARGPTGAVFDGANDRYFAAKVKNFTKAHPDQKFTGPVAFLNSWSYQLSAGLLTPLGAADEFRLGASFFTSTGRLLYNLTTGETSYNKTFVNGTARPKPTLRTTSQSRIIESARSWAAGFFGVDNTTDLYDLTVIPEGGTENNTLASYDGCTNDNVEAIGYNGDDAILGYAEKYLKPSVSRLSSYVPSGFKLTTNDTFAMQSLCAYETSSLGSSDFCSLFTQSEWEGFEYALDIDYWYDYAYGNPTGRAQGVGAVQEWIARLKNEYIKSSNSSVNSTLDGSPSTFPLGQPMYVDFTHDDIEVSAVTAMSLDYFKPYLPIDYPPPKDRTFVLSHLTPFGGNLRLDLIGCKSSSPTPKQKAATLYTRGQYGYDSSNATHKFVRISWNNAPLPLSTIRGGECAGRKDELCPLDKFLDSQKNLDKLANYQFACFGNYTEIPKDFGYDGTIYASQV